MRPAFFNCSGFAVALLACSAAVAQTKPTPPLETQGDQSAGERQRPENAELEQQRALRTAAEAAVRSRLIDPDSAEFDWPYGFANGWWKPFLSRRIDGYVTCGRVNARNRFGGYTGSSSFVVVMSEDAQVKYLQIGTAGQIDPTDIACEKAAKTFPAAIPENSQPAPTPVASVADEIEKLAALRDRGILTQAEFEAQKAKLLGEQP